MATTASSQGSIGSRSVASPTRSVTSPTSTRNDANGTEDIRGSKKFRAQLRNAARKLQEKLILDAQNLVSSGFAELPAIINLSFVLENVGGAVKECHVQKTNKSDQPKSTLFDWVWNEKEMPRLIVLGSWWLCAILSRGKAPIGKEIGPLNQHGMETLKKVEDVALRGLAKLFSTILSHYAMKMKQYGGLSAQRSGHTVFSSMLPDAIARATRDCAFLTWPHLRPFLETSDCCMALVGIWSFLITGTTNTHTIYKHTFTSTLFLLFPFYLYN